MERQLCIEYETGNLVTLALRQANVITLASQTPSVKLCEMRNLAEI